MAYQVYIQREDGRLISLEEWQNAVRETPGIRLSANETKCINPKTGEIIAIPNIIGNAEVFFAASSNWISVFRWVNGKIIFKGLPDGDAFGNLVLDKAKSMSKLLDARLVGEENEYYD